MISFFEESTRSDNGPVAFTYDKWYSKIFLLIKGNRGRDSVCEVLSGVRPAMWQKQMICKYYCQIWIPDMYFWDVLRFRFG